MSATAKGDTKWDDSARLYMSKYEAAYQGSTADDGDKTTTFYIKLWENVFGTVIDNERREKIVAMRVLDDEGIGSGVNVSVLGKVVENSEELRDELDVFTCFDAKQLGALPEMRKGKIRRYDSEEKDEEEWKIGFAGSCELLVQMCTDEKGRDWTRGFSLPFKESLLLRTMKTLHIPLEWLVMRSNDIGTCYVDGSIHTDRNFIIQTPFYRSGGVWALAFTIRNPRGAAPKEPVYMADTTEAEECEEGTSAVKAIGLFEANAIVDLASIVEEVRTFAATYRHPLLLPIQMLSYHVHESARQFMSISRELTEIEEAIDPAAIDVFHEFDTGGAKTQTSYGALSKRLYQCSNSLVELDRRRDFEKRLSALLLKEVCIGTREVFGSGDAVSYWIHERNMARLQAVTQRIEAVMEMGDLRSLDLVSLPRRIDGLIGLIRNLVSQQDSQANIQIARLTLQENNQMRALTEASLSIAEESRRIALAAQKDSNAMKKIAALTTAFLPGTYIASLFSTTMFNFQTEGGPSVSSYFWIYWVVTLPLTILVFSALQYWMHRREVKDRKSLPDEEKTPLSKEGTKMQKHE